MSFSLSQNHIAVYNVGTMRAPAACKNIRHNRLAILPRFVM